MLTDNREIRLDIVQGKAPPTAFMILKDGLNDTTKGPVLMNANAGRSVLARMRELGRDRLNFDYGHGQLGFVQSYESARSAGWFTPEIRGGELWASDIQWTPQARQALANREFRYFSPALLLDRETSEVRELINVALTNIPATKGQTPLVASALGAPPAPSTRSLAEIQAVLAEIATRYPDAGSLQLSEDERRVCEMLNVDPAAYAAERALLKGAR